MTYIYPLNNNIIFIVNFFNEFTFDKKKRVGLIQILSEVLPNHVLKHKLINEIIIFSNMKRKQFCNCFIRYDIYLGDFLNDIILEIVNTKNKNNTNLDFYRTLINLIYD